jgi:hypothetical protein
VRDIATKDDLNKALEMQALRITLRIGIMLTAALGVMITVIDALMRCH